MTLNFDFAFLGPEHSYVASVTYVTGSGHLVEPFDTACFRVPASFTKGYETAAKTRYISDIRGHDYLSHMSRYATADSHGTSPKSDNMINEIKDLEDLGRELQEKGYHQADFKLSLGPWPGSFFADVKKLREYHWEEVPGDLKKVLRREVAHREYGTISDVAMNATGGWVMHFCAEGFLERVSRQHKRPSQFCWGGGKDALPTALVTALENGRDEGKKIRHIFLNHQNSDEYLLLFNDGSAHISLHDDFKDKIHKLVKTWAKRTLKKKVKWDFTYSCQCLESSQKEADAAYYNRRGLFYIRRALKPGLSCQNIDLALEYLGEAISLDPHNKEIKYHHRLALAAARRIKRDSVLESKISEARSRDVPQISLMDARDLSTEGVFRNQYLQFITSEEDCRALVQNFSQLQPPESAWSCCQALDSDKELSLGSGLGSDNSQYRNSMTGAPAPVEMLGSIPSVNGEQWFMVQRRDTAQRYELSSPAPSQRRPSELSDEQVVVNRMRMSSISYEPSGTAQMTMLALNSTQNAEPQMLPPELENTRVDNAQRRPPESSNERILANQRRLSELAWDERTVPQRMPRFSES